jgi:hypothetical protein
VGRILLSKSLVELHACCWLETLTSVRSNGMPLLSGVTSLTVVTMHPCHVTMHPCHTTMHPCHNTAGHNIEYDGDVGVFTDPSNQYQPVPSNFTNAFHDSVVCSDIDGENLFSLTPNTCSGTNDDFPHIYNVKVFSPSGKTTVCNTPIAT